MMDNGNLKNPTAAFWQGEITAALRREKNWRKEAKNVVDVYEAEDEKKVPFNILYSNTETLAPALYNSTPRPVVRRRYSSGGDQKALAACELGKRTLQYILDNGDQAYEPFDDLMEAAVRAALVPGRGLMRWDYKATLKTVEDEDGQPAQEVEKELVCAKEWPWDRVCMGYARTWEKLPWIAYKHAMTKEDFEKNFGTKYLEELKFDNEADKSEGEACDDEAKLSDAEATVVVYEIWSKIHRKIYFVTSGVDAILKDFDDPYGLEGFFDCQKPLQLFRRAKGSLIPVPLYRFYKSQAVELNKVTNRMRAIVDQIRVRGVYDSSMGDDIEKIFNEEFDGALIPTTSPAAMQQNGGLDRAIWLVPLEKLVNTYQVLSQQRQAIKQTIYEITGVSDILRGSSVASETATAQEIKNKWGTLRLKDMQKRVSAFAKEGLRLALELAVTRISAKTLKEMTQVPYPLAAEKEQWTAQVQMLQASGQQIPPQMQELMQMPTVEELKELLSNDISREYQIDVETNSTIDAEMVEDKADLNELLVAVSQFMGSVGPLIQQGVLPFEVAKAMLMAVTRRYTLGPEFESQLAALQAPQQGGDPKAQEQVKKAQEELQKKEQDLMRREQELQLQEKQLQGQFELQKKELELLHRFNLQEIELTKQAAQRENQMKLKGLEDSVKMQVAAAIERFKMTARNHEAGEKKESEETS